MQPPRLDVALFDRAVVEDPYPVYETIRTAGRVVRNEEIGAWMVPGFEDCSTILTDPGDRFGMLNGDPDVVFWIPGRNMIQVDGAEHQRLRRCLAPKFTRSAVAGWERRVQEVVDELLAPLLAGRSDYDLIADFTMIPTVIVAEMLGVPRDHHEDFRRWSHVIVSNLAYGHEDPKAREAMGLASDELCEYLMEEIKGHRASRPDDLISAMLDMADMTDEEILSTAHLLLVAGYDTTAKLMSTCLMVLEQHPVQRGLIATDLSLVPGAIEEVIRWAGVAQMTPRVVVRDSILAGVELSEGDTVYALTGAANRDPDRWTDPDRFDVHRDPKANLGFGFGPHLCLGAPLARLETKVTIERLLTIAPEYRLRGIDMGGGLFVRGPARGIIDLGA